MRVVLSLSALGLLLIALATLPLHAQSGASAQSATTVEVGALWFCEPSDSACMTTVDYDIDSTITINVGDTVTWDWVPSLVPHTTTACSGSDFATCDASQGWDSGLQSTPFTFFHTFGEAGTFYYRCEVHPIQMRGQINVVAAAQPTATPTAAPTASPTGSPTAPPTGSPAAPPAGGGLPAADGAEGASLWWLLLAAGGGLLLTTSGFLSARWLRR